MGILLSLFFARELMLVLVFALLLWLTAVVECLAQLAMDLTAEFVCTRDGKAGAAHGSAEGDRNEEQKLAEKS